MPKILDPAAGGAQVLKATTKKVVNFFEKKVHPRSFCAPQCTILATRFILGHLYVLPSLSYPVHYCNLMLLTNHCILLLFLSK